ncbi:hypothetical protein [Flammeovirga sp. OC4]|uniref:hypothetical protein n=1 Tax=Flammeovirga sp. OC4 TaxID=1382345 RepID=UPI0005C515E0|nr:hypothetical protein [Flammeovirga sp. OC4]
MTKYFFSKLITILLCLLPFFSCSLFEDKAKINKPLELQAPSYIRGMAQIELLIQDQVQLEMNDVQLFCNGKEVPITLKQSANNYVIAFDSKGIQEGLQLFSVRIPKVKEDTTSEFLTAEAAIEVDNFLPPFKFETGYVDQFNFRSESGLPGYDFYYLQSISDYKYNVYFADAEGNVISKVYDVSTCNEEIEIELDPSIIGQDFYFVRAEKYYFDYIHTAANEEEHIENHKLTYEHVSSSDQEMKTFRPRNDDSKLILKIAHEVSRVYKNFGGAKSQRFLYSDEYYSYHEFIYRELEQNEKVYPFIFYSDDKSRGVAIVFQNYESGSTVSVELEDIQDAIAVQPFPEKNGEWIYIESLIDIHGKDVYCSNNLQSINNNGKERVLFPIKDNKIKTFAVSRSGYSDDFMAYSYSTKHVETLPIAVSSIELNRKNGDELKYENGIYSISRKDFMDEKDNLSLVAKFETGIKDGREQLTEVTVESKARLGAKMDLGSGISSQNLYDGYFESLRPDHLKMITSNYESNKSQKENGYYLLQVIDLFKESSSSRKISNYGDWKQKEVGEMYRINP